jgi:hypothetical protein
MKNQKIITRLAATCAGILASTIVRADAQQDNPSFNAGVKAAQQDAQFIQGVQASSEEADLQKLLHSPEGVSNPKFDPASGALLKVHIVVKTPLSRALPPQYAEMAARKTADINAKALFTKWLKSNCGVRESAGVEVISQAKGTSDGQNGVASEEGVATTKISSMSDVSAQGATRGIIGITEEIDPTTGKMTSIFGWSKKLTSGAMDAEAAVNKSNPAAEANRASSANSPASSAQGASPSATGGPIQNIQLQRAKAAGINDF